MMSNLHSKLERIKSLIPKLTNTKLEAGLESYEQDGGKIEHIHQDIKLAGVLGSIGLLKRYTNVSVAFEPEPDRSHSVAPRFFNY